MKFKRARSSEQIENRKQEILKCALSIYEKHGHQDVHFSNIAKKTKFTRPTIYTYFKTKEEIFLLLILHYAKAATKFLEEKISAKETFTIEEVTDIFTDVIIEVPEYIKLYSILYPVIIPNASLEAIAEFRSTLLGFEAPFTILLKHAFPEITPMHTHSFLVMYHSVACGYYPMAHSKAMQEAERTLLNRDSNHNYRELLHKFLYNYFYCLEKKFKK